MKAKFLLAATAFLLSTMTAMAIPAKPVKKTVVKADGSTIELTLRGDEHYSYYTDDQGTAYQLSANGQLRQLSADAVAEKWTNLKKQRLARIPQKAGARTRAPWQAGTPGATTGKHRGLVILIDFKDQKFSTENVQKTFDDFFNKEGYNQDGMGGSVKDYFLKQSYGQLEIDFDVVGPYSANGSMAHYGAHDGDNNDVRPTELIMEAIDAAAKDVDYSNYDWDNDGEVDQIYIIYAGYAEAHGADENTIWPHEWALSAQGIKRSYNGKVINTYACSSELMGDGKRSTGVLDGIGTACHEFSHCLGLPDMYDTQGDNFGMGYWDVMAVGCYNDNSRTPAGFTSYERMFSSWLTPTELKDMTRISGMKPLEDGQEAYILYNEANKNEYYLLENRQKVGFDKGLYGHGLLVLHVDYDAAVWTSNTVNTSADHQCMTIIPADNQLVMSASSMAADPYPGTKNNTSLTNYTTPAATTYNANSDGGKLMNKPIDNITESEDGLISFVVCRPELGIPEPDNGTEETGAAAFTIKWPAVSGAVSYEVEVTEIGTASTDPKEALQREFNFDEFVSKTTGFSDVSSKMADYGLRSWSGSKLFTTPNKMRLGSSTSAGYVRTATWSVPQSSEMTIVMGADVVKAGDVVKGQVRVAFGNSGDQASYDNQNFEVKGNGRQVFHFSVRKDLFWIEIRPETQMYLNYLAVYDGTWSAWQLGIDHARQYAPRKATTVNVYTTQTNSLSLKDLNPSSRYIYRVRAMGEENTYSQWSEEKTFSFSPAGIDNVTMDALRPTDKVYDLQGRQVGIVGDGLKKGIYIIGGRKYVQK